MIDQDSVFAIARLLQNDPPTLFVTGAGLSADSGLPTYRGIGGLYDRDFSADGMPIEEALSGATFRRRPELTWKYVRQIARAGISARPNRGHEVIAALERRLSRCWVLTQNVDGLHREAGSRNLVEIHGDVHRLVCTRCRFAVRVVRSMGGGPAPGASALQDVFDAEGVDDVPRCPECFAVVRPDVVLFGEMLPDEATRTLRRELARGFGLVFSVGTSSLFPYIAGPVADAAHRGIPTVEINPDRTSVSRLVRWHLRCGAAEALGAIADELDR